MRPEIRRLLERQAAWQRARRAKPWAEKLRVSVAMRKALLAFRKGSTAQRDNS